MIKKRLIFTLLYSDNFFFQSRNFNLQRVGDVNWLRKNYNFRNISFFIDELIILNISRGEKKRELFLENVKKISEFCFVPVTIGGGIKSLEDAKYYLQNISDKILVNTGILENLNLASEITKIYGEQSLLIGFDLKKIDNKYFIFSNNGEKKEDNSPEEILKKISNQNFGELFLNSIDQDGTGTGLDYDMLKLIPKDFKKPIILSGGTGNYKHIYEGLKKKNVSAISSSNLLNFVGDGLIKTRNELLLKKIPFPDWDSDQLKKLEFFHKK
tara:strand:- start:1631 stop:2440 length:810 start_codon:yes stop_codon:yes gene_type:complete